jgi:choline dehydrogenase-like flavoprotein
MTGATAKRARMGAAAELGAAEKRTLRACAEAMAPAVGDLPAASGQRPAAGSVDAVAELEPLLRLFPRRSLLGLRLGLRAFEWMTFPRRFSRLSLEARRTFLQEAERSRSATKRDLLLLLKVLTGLGYTNDSRVRQAVGYEARCAVADVDDSELPAVAPAPLGDLEPSESAESCDFVVVGSGAGGAVVAAALAEAGHEVLLLEAGPYVDRGSYPDEPLAAMAALYRDGGLTVAEGRPAVPTPVGRVVGGTTVINSGTCFRTPEAVLERWVSEHGIGWASELEGDYAAAEEIMHVTPVDPETMGRNGQLVREGAEALGLSHAPLSRNAGRCTQCSSCPNGCRLDAKRAMHVSYLPRAVAAGARVRAGVEARRVTFRGGRAVGVECRAGVADPGQAGRPFTVHARRGVVLAGGAFGTPELLLRSNFVSASGQLGRNLRVHPASWVGGRFDEEVRGWDGVMQSYAVDEWDHLGVLLEATFTPLAFGGQWLPGTGVEHQERMLHYDQIASTGIHLSDRSSGRVGLARDGSLRIAYQLNRDDAERLVFGIARAAEILYAAGAREVYPQISGMLTLPRGRIADLEASPPSRRALRLEAFHPMGTARMDADPARGVTGTDGAVHGAEALYVADASLLPSSIGVNPMMTIVAIASRVAGQLAERSA